MVLHWSQWQDHFFRNCSPLWHQPNLCEPRWSTKMLSFCSYFHQILHRFDYWRGKQVHRCWKHHHWLVSKVTIPPIILTQDFYLTRELFKIFWCGSGPLWHTHTRFLCQWILPECSIIHGNLPRHSKQQVLVWIAFHLKWKLGTDGAVEIRWSVWSPISSSRWGSRAMRPERQYQSERSMLLSSRLVWK